MIKRIVGPDKCKWFYTKCPYYHKSHDNIYGELEEWCRMIIPGNGVRVYGAKRHPECKKESPDGLYLIDHMGISDLGGML